MASGLLGNQLDQAPGILVEPVGVAQVEHDRPAAALGAQVGDHRPHAALQPSSRILTFVW